MKKSRRFYGWRVVGATFVANFMATGTGFYSFNAWLQPICSARGWTRTEVNFAAILGVIIGLVCQPVYGRLLPKYGPRMIMLIGAFFSGISFALMGRMQNLGFFYLFAIILFLSNGAFHGIVPNTAVSYWFERKRGKALGISTASISLSGVLIPPLALFLLKKFGLETMFLMMGLLTWALVISASALFMKNKPEDYGLFPDGIEPPELPETQASPSSGTLVSAPKSAGTLSPNQPKTELPPLSYFLRLASFWMLGIAFGLVMMGVVGVMIQLKPRFSDLGFSDQKAMTLMALTALIGTLGKYSWGRLCDSFDPRKVIAWMFLFQILGLIILVYAKSQILLLFFVLLFGFGMGGVMSTFPIVVANFFTRENFPKVYGYISLFLLLQCGGYLLMGKSFDLLGTYNYAYLAFIIMDALAIILILLAQKPSGHK